MAWRQCRSVKCGFRDADWADAKQEMIAILAARAKLRGMSPYSDLVAHVKAKIDPASFALAAMLEEISEADDLAGRGMLTVIVVHKPGDMQPGPGFFNLAKRLGRDTSDIVNCWVHELRRMHTVGSL